MICLDIPMPENCGQCHLMADGWCRVLQAGSHLNRYAADMEKRPDWCPLKRMKRYCRYKGIACEFATEYEYCQLTSCVQYRIFVQNMSDANRQTILNLPSAQPERKKGEWEEIGVIAGAYDINGVKTWASKIKCNQCGFTAIAIEGHFSQYNFCPCCGARMEGKDGDGNEAD